MRPIDILILGLTSEKPRHGYDITREIVTRGIRNWIRVSDVAVYKALARLEREGSLVSITQREGKSPERSVYELTGAGRERLADLLFDQLSTSEPIRNEYFLPFEFVEVIDHNELALALERRIESVQRILEGRRARLQLIDGVEGELICGVYRHEVEVYESELAWLEGTLELIMGEPRDVT
jgi:DNA-binding PadR family transcriptional regulator